MNRQEAMRLGKTRYMGKPCAQGHNGERYTRNHDCVKCRNALKQKAYERKKESRPPKGTLTDEERKIRMKESQAKYYHTPKATAARRAKKARLRAAKRNQIPKWLTKEDKHAIKKLYELALYRTMESGVIWEVDHIIPLNGKLVSGLHVPGNLRVVTQKENRSKSNIFEI